MPGYHNPGSDPTIDRREIALSILFEGRTNAARYSASIKNPVEALLYQNPPHQLPTLDQFIPEMTKNPMQSWLATLSVQHLEKLRRFGPNSELIKTRNDCASSRGARRASKILRTRPSKFVEFGCYLVVSNECFAFSPR